MGEPAQSNYLGNQFLIAMPQLAGSYFADTVTYLCKHDEQGALGIVINKPLGPVIDIFNELDISCDLQDSRFDSAYSVRRARRKRQRVYRMTPQPTGIPQFPLHRRFQSAHPEKSSGYCWRSRA